MFCSKVIVWEDRVNWIDPKYIMKVETLGNLLTCQKQGVIERVVKNASKFFVLKN